MRPAAFAFGSAIDHKSGAYLYERALCDTLRTMGHKVAGVAFPGTFPDASPADMARAGEILAALPPDRPVILGGFAFGAFDTGLLARVTAPVVAMVHHPLGLETGLAPARAQDLLHREAANLALAAHVVVPSPHTARLLAADFAVPAEKITIALPGFAEPDSLRAPLTPPLILAVGVLNERKGHDVLIRALARIADLPWTARIVGRAPDPAPARALARQIEDAGLAPRITLQGAMEAQALAALYRQATVFALATRYEGYGMVFGEALLHGLPIVTCRTGAVPETVPPDAGILVAVDDDRAFAGALRHLLTDAPARAAMARAATVAGHALPRWRDAAAAVGGVLDAVRAQNG